MIMMFAAIFSTQGIDKVIINSQIVVDKNKHLKALAGKILDLTRMSD
ncbi:MAG: hypothetical protein ACTSVY_02725 [Candidatus Helarchaeota archaeon]